MRKLIAGLGLLALAGCQPKTVKVGVVLPLSASGEVSGYARDVLNGVYLALDELGGTVRGAKIEVIEQDYAGDEAKLAEAIKNLDQQGVVAIIGPLTSADVLSVKGLIKERKIPVLVPAATLNSATEECDYMWRVCINNAYMAQAVAYLLGRELGIKEAAVIEQSGNPYSEELTTNFREFFGQEGGKVVKLVAREKDKPVCDSGVVKEILGSFTAAQESTAVFAPLYYKDAAEVVKALRAAGYKGVVVGADGWDNKKLPDLLGQGIGVNYFVTHFQSAEDRAKPFVAAYTNKYNEAPSSFAALGYDAMKALHEALDKAQSLSRDALNEQLGITSIQGVTGDIAFSKDTHEPGAKGVAVVKLVDEGFRFFKRFALSPYGAKKSLSLAH